MYLFRMVVATGMLALAASSVQAQCASGCADTSNCAQCPNCNAHCVFEANCVDVDKKCYEVECKPICVPRVRFPWQTCCEPMCADVRYVKVLKTSSYTCSECEYSWRIEEGAACADGCEVQVPATGEPTPAPVPETEASGTAFRILDGGLFRRNRVSQPRPNQLPVIQTQAIQPAVESVVPQRDVMIDRATGKPVSSRRIVNR